MLYELNWVFHGDAAAPDTPFAMLETSRGCPMPCGYCYKQMFGDRQSKRDPKHDPSVAMFATSQRSTPAFVRRDSCWRCGSRV